MSGFFGAISKQDCVYDVFYGTDYHSHLGTKRAGMVFYNKEEGFRRSIHSLENGYFRSKFEADLELFQGNSGLGIISDTDPQPILFNSHMGRFAITTVCRMVNMAELERYFLDKKSHFTENFLCRGTLGRESAAAFGLRPIASDEELSWWEFGTDDDCRYWQWRWWRWWRWW